MKIRNLDTFFWVASLGSFRAASQKLNLTQPAISARIQVLEEDLGCSVFARDFKNGVLSPAGRKLLPYAERLMQLDQDVLEAFSESSAIEQTIRLGASETIVSTWLPDFLTHLARFQKGLSFDLTVDATDNLRNSLVARELDIAFLMGPVAEVSVTNHDICSFEMVFAAVPQLSQRHQHWTYKNVASTQILTFANNTKPSRNLRELLKPHSSTALKMTTSSSLGALIRLVKAGYGVCAVPRAAIANELASGELQELRTVFNIPNISFTASYVSGMPTSGLMRSLSSKVVEFLKG